VSIYKTDDNYCNWGMLIDMIVNIETIEIGLTPRVLRTLFPTSSTLNDSSNYYIVLINSHYLTSHHIANDFLLVYHILTNSLIILL